MSHMFLVTPRSTKRGSISIQILIFWPLKWCAREPGLLCNNHEISSVGQLLCLTAQYLKDHISDTYQPSLAKHALKMYQDEHAPIKFMTGVSLNIIMGSTLRTAAI